MIQTTIASPKVASHIFGSPPRGARLFGWPASESATHDLRLLDPAPLRLGAELLGERFDVFHRPDVGLHERLGFVVFAPRIGPSRSDARDHADLHFAPTVRTIRLGDILNDLGRLILRGYCGSIRLLDEFSHAKAVTFEDEKFGRVGGRLLRGSRAGEGAELLTGDLGADALGNSLYSLERCSDAESLQGVDAVAELAPAADLGERLAKSIALPRFGERERLVTREKKLCGTCGTCTTRGSRRRAL